MARRRALSAERKPASPTPFQPVQLAKLVDHVPEGAGNLNRATGFALHPWKDNEMPYADQHVTIDSIFGTLSARIDRAALQRLSDAPEDMAITDNRALIDQIASMKFEAGEAEDDGVIRISAADSED